MPLLGSMFRPSPFSQKTGSQVSSLRVQTQPTHNGYPLLSTRPYSPAFSICPSSAPALPSQRSQPGKQPPLAPFALCCFSWELGFTPFQGAKPPYVQSTQLSPPINPSKLQLINIMGWSRDNSAGRGVAGCDHP